MANANIWGVNKTGFYRPTVEDIIAEKVKKAKEIFGDDFDTGEQTPQGKFFRVNAAAESKLCEIAEQIYYSIFPSTATGVSLDRVCEFANLQRESAGFAAHNIRVYGNQGHEIGAGTLFKNPAGIQFYCTKPYIINTEEKENDISYYYTDITVYCTESGTVGNVHNINSLVAVDTSINSVVWQNIIAPGSDTETDSDLREKFSTVVQGLGTNTASAIMANVLRVSGVNDVKIIDNATTQEINVGDLTINPRSYAVIVYADSLELNEEIAKAIYEKSSLGIVQSGKEKVLVIDDSGIEHSIYFTYVESVPIKVSVTCDVSEDFSGDIEDIRNSITSYFSTLGIGNPVVYTYLYKCLYDVAGIERVTNITVNDSTEDIDISQIQIASVGQIIIDTTIV